MLWSPLFLRDPGNIVAVRCDLLATSCLRLVLVFGLWSLVFGLWPLAFGLWCCTWISKSERPKT
jgi:hypothetical protein